MKATYVVTFTLLGKSRSVDVWADSPNEARRYAIVAYPGAVVTDAKIRRAF